MILEDICFCNAAIYQLYPSFNEDNGPIATFLLKSDAREMYGYLTEHYPDIRFVLTTNDGTSVTG